MGKTSPAAAAASTLTGKERRELLARRAERSAIERDLEKLDQREAAIVAATAALDTTGFCACGCGNPVVNKDWFGTPIVNLSAAPPKLPSRLRAARSRLTTRLRELDEEDREAVRSAAETRRRWRTLRPGLVAAASQPKPLKPARRAELVAVSHSQPTMRVRTGALARRTR